MHAKIFVDTNILVYAFSKSKDGKQKKAIDLLDNAHLTISTQVIREFINVGINKHGQPLNEIMGDVTNIASVADIVNEDMETIEKAVEVHNKYQYRFYDCLILAAALKAGCDILLSEDMQNGQVIEGTLKIVNPFC
jgi:predicted nucleic acid-binding protein